MDSDDSDCDLNPTLDVNMNDNNPASINSASENPSSANLAPDHGANPDPFTSDEGGLQTLVQKKKKKKEEEECQDEKTPLKKFLPDATCEGERDVLPTKRVGFFNFVSVHWMTSLMWKAYKRKLRDEDLWSLPPEETSEVNGDHLEKLWKEEVELATKFRRRARLWRPVWYFVRRRLFMCQALTVLMDLGAFAGPIVFLQSILNYIDSVGISHLYGASLLVGNVLIAVFLPTMFLNMNYLLGIHNSSRLGGALQALVYKKILTLRTRGDLAAQLINFSSSDMERIFEACMSSVFLVEVPVNFLLCLCYCVFAFGPWAAVGFSVYVLVYIIMVVLAKCQKDIRERTILETDARVSLMSEILNSMKLIKMFAWEEPFAKRVAGIREREMRKHRLAALLNSVTNTLTPSVGILATIATTLSFTFTGKAITSSEAFTILSLFTMMGYTVSILPYVMKCVAEADVSLARMESILTLSEHKKVPQCKDISEFAIQIQEAAFDWEPDGNGIMDERSEDLHSEKIEVSRMLSQALLTTGPAVTSLTYRQRKSFQIPSKLCQINLSVPHGKLVGVCGVIGSGKSSLISAICGDMQLKGGSMHVNGRVALVTQHAWIYNGTLRENLLLGAPFDVARYRKAIQVCCLQPDLDQLPAGDLTEIGDRGINLSGGQKQRVNLARAVYSDRDIYVIDDPLSAVDAKVANSIFNGCIKGHLKGKTVLLVTHALHVLEQCDEIVVMQDGRIIEKGSHTHLLGRRGNYSQMVQGILSGESQNSEVRAAEGGEIESEESLGLKGKLTSEETRQSGVVALRVYTSFIKACGGWPVASVLITVVASFVVIRILSSVWLKIWLDEGDGLSASRLQNATAQNLTLSEEDLKGSITDNPRLWMYQLVYGVSFCALVVVGLVKGIVLTFSLLRGASTLHNDMFRSILFSPMSFFDTTPSGRILNRFSRDLDELDVRIPYFLEFLAQGILGTLGLAILICTIYVWFTAPLLTTAFVLCLLDSFMNAGVRELKRIDNLRKSPVIQHIGSSLAGLSVIRTFDQQDLFTRRMYQYLDDHTAAQLVYRLSTQWYVFRMQMLFLLLKASLTGLCIFTKGLVTTATAGLALSVMTLVYNEFNYLMKVKAEFLSRFTAVERLVEYSQDLVSEAPSANPEAAPEGWPALGKVQLKEVSFRYRPDLPLVLQNIDVVFEPGQKIGVVGRTGAGKSSLIAAVLRLVEVESGQVLIDEIDISNLSLHSVRSAVSVIPQDPLLFQGSIRYNLDPFEEHDEPAIWEALEQSSLKRVVQQQDKGLMSTVATAGENFALGERQLICLTRALLRKSKILLLDEATASVDLETDQMIQSTIRKAFAQSTVITIAHRLNTITSYDKVLVLQEGRMIEFDTPEALIQRQGSLFGEMMAAMGVTTVDQMRTQT
ncbi:ATP-binding cassette sub-family C member 12-like [Macrobrachium nipponense]|uniref:ATP-binding cassette sub-family C member 12-like n=1 Tax=Macrobrachium nipponense TaxID=159736 RepID=UPI0030C80D94